MIGRLFWISRSSAAAPAAAWTLQTSSSSLGGRWMSTEVPVKPTTTLVGLPVVTNPREVIEFLANKILEEIQTIPECYYRSEVEAMARNRLKVATEEHDWRRIEERLGSTLHVEEIIDEMEDELTLIPKAREARIWDVPADHKIKVTIENSPILLDEEDLEYDAQNDPSEIRVSNTRPQSLLESVLHADLLSRVVRVDPHFEDPEVTSIFEEDYNPERTY
ncbi:MAG: complex I NDUFA5 subunit family protein [archaeon]|nr:complex I NDUFA5 subunit family protein [archaeon]